MMMNRPITSNILAGLSIGNCVTSGMTLLASMPASSRDIAGFLISLALVTLPTAATSTFLLQRNQPRISALFLGATLGTSISLATTPLFHAWANHVIEKPETAQSLQHAPDTAHIAYRVLDLQYR